MIKCERFTKVNKGALVGYADLYVDKWDLEIKGVQLLEKNGSRWVNFPSKEYEKDGGKKYMPYVRLKKKENYERFMEEAKNAIDLKLMESKPLDEEMPF